MPSSTSSSSDRLPKAPYGRLWLLFVLILAGALASTEIFWRTHGYLPSVVDSKMFWCLHRDRAVSDRGKPKLVIIGASRAQLGIDPTAIGEELPDFEVVHLAIDGTPPYEVLKDLCTDPAFDGTIVCTTTMGAFYPADPQGDRRDLAYTQFYRNEFHDPTHWRERIDLWFEATLQARLVLLSPRLSLRSMLTSMGLPQPMYLHMHFDRYRPSFYRDRTTPEQLEQIRERREPSIEGVETNTNGLDPAIGEELRSLCDTLRARGGRIVLVRMPTTGTYWECNNIRFPKETYWDQIESWAGIPTIHFLDHPELSQYECPDTSHLDATDAHPFSHDLGRILRGLLSTDPP